MSALTDRSRNISTNTGAGDVALAIADPADAGTTISILALPDIGEIILPGGAALTIGQTLTGEDLTRLIYRPATEGAGNDRFSYRLTDEDSRRTDVDIDVSTTGRVEGTALYFEAETWEFGSELWRLLPTGQVEQVADIHEGSAHAYPRYITRLGDTIYFAAVEKFDLRDSTGSEPWRVGPDGNAVPLGEINPGRLTGQPSYFTQYNGTLYFQATNVDTGSELYRIGADGSAELVADLVSGSDGSRPGHFTAFDGALYFIAETDGGNLWRITATGEVERVGTMDVAGNSSGTDYLYEQGGSLYFGGTVGDTDGTQLWRVGGDGVPRQITDTDDIGRQIKPRAMQEFAGQLWFQADAPSLGENFDIYRLGSDGDPILAVNLLVGGLLSEIHHMQVFGEALYFGVGGGDADGNEVGRELWRVFADGRLELMADLKPGRPSSNPRDFTLFGDAMYFTADDGTHGQELWRVTADGELEMAADLNPGDGHGVNGLHVFDGALYFSGNDGVSGAELWRMSVEGTMQQVSDINDGAPDSYPSDFEALPISRSVGMPDGSRLDDILHGSDAADISDAGPGNDRMVGLGGDDVLTGGVGDDDLDGGAGTDTAVFDTDSTGVTAVLAGDVFTITSDQGIDRVTGVESFRFNDRDLSLDDMTALAAGGVTETGTAGDDDINGGDGDDVLDGLDGNDRLVAMGGNDTLNGGDGADTLNGGDGDDVITGGATDADLRDVVYGGDGNDSVDAGYGNDLVFGQGGNDTIAGGFGVDELQGQDGDDVITGSAFSDLVFGGDGDDFVNGGFGHDRINAGAGADKIFHVGGTEDQMLGHGSDWVQDYSSAEGDVLLFGDATATASQFQVNTAHTANGEGERSGDDNIEEAFVIYRPTGQILWALVDGEGQDQINLQIGTEVFDLLA